MATDMDATIKALSDQSYAGTMSIIQNGFAAGSVRRNDDANFVTAAAQTAHLLGQQLVGAKAAGQLDRDSLAKGVLDARMSAGQPGNAPVG